MVKQKRWEEIPCTAFVDKIGQGKQLCLVNTRYVRITWQKFLSGTRVDYHNHKTTKEWEIVLRIGFGICLSIYPPTMDHCLFGSTKQKGTWWSIISIKIGKKP